MGAKKRGESPAFVAFYEAYPRREARPRAWAAWVAQGCEGIAEEVMRGVANWKPEHFRRAAKDPSTVPHPASWLNARQWQDAPPAPPAAKAKDTRCAFHLNWNNHHRKPPGGWYAECPECKEARAALGTRQGDPTPTVDALAATERKVRELRDAAGKTWTPDQLAEMRATRAQKIREPAEPRPPPLNAPSAASPAVHPGGSSVDGSGTPAGYPGVVSKGGS